MGFEKFDEAGRGRGRNPGTDPMVSIRKSGSIGVNGPVLAEYFEDDDGAVMYFDADENRMGIEPVADADADDAAYTVSKTDAGGTIAPKAFLREYDLVPDVTTQYAPELDDDEGLITIDLDEPMGTYGSPDEDGGTTEGDDGATDGGESESDEGS